MLIDTFTDVHQVSWISAAYRFILCYFLHVFTFNMSIIASVDQFDFVKQLHVCKRRGSVLLPERLSKYTGLK